MIKHDFDQYRKMMDKIRDCGKCPEFDGSGTKKQVFRKTNIGNRLKKM